MDIHVSGYVYMWIGLFIIICIHMFIMDLFLRVTFRAKDALNLNVIS